MAESAKHRAYIPCPSSIPQRSVVNCWPTKKKTHKKNLRAFLLPSDPLRRSVERFFGISFASHRGEFFSIVVGVRIPLAALANFTWARKATIENLGSILVHFMAVT